MSIQDIDQGGASVVSSKRKKATLDTLVYTTRASRVLSSDNGGNSPHGQQRQVSPTASKDVIPDSPSRKHEEDCLEACGALEALTSAAEMSTELAEACRFMDNLAEGSVCDDIVPIAVKPPGEGGATSPMCAMSPKESLPLVENPPPEDIETERCAGHPILDPTAPLWPQQIANLLACR